MSKGPAEDPALTVVTVGPVLELYGHLDPALLETALARTVARRADLCTWRVEAGDAGDAPAVHHGELYARLRRHGPAHHTLCLTARGSAAAAPDPHPPVGLLADLLTAPTGPAPLERGLRAVLDALHRAPHRAHHSLLLRLHEAVDPDILRRALRTVAAAHPMVCTPLGPAPGGGLLLGTRAQGPQAPQDCLTTARFPDRTAFDAAVADTRRGLDPRSGASLRALHAQGGIPGSGTADLLFLAVHDLAADPASWRVLLEDLDMALEALMAGREPQLCADEGRRKGWATGPAPTDTGRWDPAGDAEPPDAHDDPAPVTATGAPTAVGTTQTQRAHFTLSPEETKRLLTVLPDHYGMSGPEVLAGAFGQAVARWLRTHDVVFDLCTDGRTEPLGRARTVGPYTRSRSVRLDSDRHLPPDCYLAAALPALTADDDSHGHVGPAPAGTRRAVPVRLVHHEPGELPGPARSFTVVSSGPGRLPQPAEEPDHGLEVRTYVEDGLLHVRARWRPRPGDDCARTTVDELCDHLRSLLERLADPAAEGQPVFAGPAVPATPRQRELLAESLADTDAGHHVEQLHWTWHGPLDSERFTAAWQVVCDNEMLLRAAFDPRDHTRITLHDRATLQVVRLSHTDTTWALLLERDRRRGLNLHRPGALRVTVLDAPRTRSGTVQQTKILLTFHQALVDTWSARLLLRAFYRAYLREGSPVGGARRPDLRDYARWLGSRDPSPAREFWARALSPRGVAVQPACAPARSRGFGRVSRRLSPSEAGRLVHWAATWGVTESIALHAAWALLLYRARGADRPAMVGFGVSVDGRGIALEGVEQLTGALSGVLPVTVDVDPAATVPELLAVLRDRALDMSAYEWAGAGQLRQWSGRSADDALFATAVRFERPVPPADDLTAQLAAQGIRVEPPQSTGSSSPLTVGLLARYDPLGRLVITAVHDRGLLADAEAAGLLVQIMRLLRTFPDRADGSRPITEVLEALPGADAPRTVPGRPDAVLVPLRAGGRADGPAVCLVPPPDADHDCYGALMPLHTGPELMLAVNTGRVEPDTVAHALRVALGPRRPLVLAGWSGSGQLARRIARSLTDAAGPGPLTVTHGAGETDAPSLARTLARVLASLDEGWVPGTGADPPAAPAHDSERP
ncbi:condensation domain-containing protein [Streptomyces sp. CA-251387]|uniref:condensation domain-containing protein n=1 Tax=Streptomyces sp. CA-251387 TaxID=3240064 RepID=UPI003D929975